jgi:chorismate mutase
MTSDRIPALRDEINGLNTQIVKLLARRVEVARSIGEAKREQDLPIVDRAREAKVYERVRELASESGLDPEGVENVFREIVDLCTRAQLEDER